jgi:tetratricopeptide (TPR) repeat protein
MALMTFKPMRMLLCVLAGILLFGPTHQGMSEGSAQSIEKASVNEKYKHAVEMLRADKIEQAAMAFQEVVKASPHFAAAYSLLGVCYSRLGRPEPAHRAFEQAVFLDARSAEARNNLGTSFLTLGKPAQAAEQFEQSIRLKPDDPSALFTLGRTRLLLKQGNPAITALSRARKLSPHDPQISLALAEAHFMAGKETSALELINPICATSGRDSDSQLAAGQILLHYRRSQEAQTCFLRAAAIDPSTNEKILALASRLVDEEDDQTALEMLMPLRSKMARSAAYYDLVGSAYAKLGKPIPAIDSFQEALRLDPANEDYYLDLGQVLEQYDAYGAAIELFQGAISARPNSARLRVGLALACLPAARMTEARGAAEKAIALDPNLETAYTTLAMVYEGEKDWQSLLRNARQLQTLNPQNYLGWYYAALAQMELPPAERPGLLPHAVDSLRHAAMLNPNFPRAPFQLGRLLLQQKDYAGAIAELKRSISLDPNYPEAHFLLARAYRSVGDLRNSQAQLEIHRKLIAETESRQHPHLDVRIKKPD